MEERGSGRRLKVAIRSLLQDPQMVSRLAVLRPASVQLVLEELDLADVGPDAIQDAILQYTQRTSQMDSPAGSVGLAGIACLVAGVMVI